jgi:histone chaperone ASF1
VGINKFELHADAPDISQIPEENILGVTVVLVTCSYREREFVRVGYYVNNEYSEPYDELTGPPKPLDMDKVRRVILSEQPRVTRFPIQWGDKDEQQQKIASDFNTAVMGAMEIAGEIHLNDIDDGEGAAGFEDEEEEDDDDLSIEGKNMVMEDNITGNAVYAVME